MVRNVICLREQPSDYPERFPVPSELVNWNSPFPDYSPALHDAPRAQSAHAKEGDYADPVDPNQVDFSKRLVLSGPLKFDEQGYPLNPGGRTGIKGRGKLNAWGPTIASDAVITTSARRGYSELLVITRADNGKPALPAGKLAVDKNNVTTESPVDAATRETLEEGGVELDFTPAQLVYSGYVDDERNTDNSWMESYAFHLRLNARQAGRLILASLEPDAEAARWEPINQSLLNRLNAMNGYMVRLALGYGKV